MRTFQNAVVASNSLWCQSSLMMPMLSHVNTLNRTDKPTIYTIQPYSKALVEHVHVMTQTITKRKLMPRPMTLLFELMMMLSVFAQWNLILQLNYSYT